MDYSSAQAAVDHDMIILSLDFHQDEEAVITETEIADYTELDFLNIIQ